MSIATEVSYTDGVTAVSAAWLNLVQEHLAGWINLQVTALGQAVTIGAAADDSAASVYINGEQRLNEADIAFTFTGAESTGTFDVYVVGDGAGPAFTMEVVSGAPAGTNTRKVAEVDYDTTLDEITAVRVERGRSEVHDHGALSGAQPLAHADLENPEVGDPHTQYVLADGSRAFTGKVVGVYPTTGDHIATKKYADDQVTSGIPVGTVIPYGGASAPSGWLLCDGTSYLVATYPNLAARLNDAYGGDGGTNFNVPDMRGVFPFGKPDAGEGSALGDTDGALDHTHAQFSHVHTQTNHTHPMTQHTHTNAGTNSTGGHSHTQGSTSTASSSDHYHAGGSHSHGVGTLVAPGSSGAVVGGRFGDQVTAGLFKQDDLDQGSSSTSHTHGDGSLTVILTNGVTGSSSSSSMSHSHAPINAKEHSHTAGALSGTTSAGTGGNTAAAGSHSHTNPTTSTTSNHTHTVGTSGSALSQTDYNLAGGHVGGGGADTTGSNNPAFVAVNYIIKVD